MSLKSNRTIAAMAASAILGAIVWLPVALRAQQSPVHPAPPAKSGGTVVMLCDGKTSIEVKDLKPGGTPSEEQGRRIAEALMEKWRQGHPDRQWRMAQADPPPASQSSAPSSRPSGASGQGAGQQQGDTYASFTSRDYKVWQTETQKFVDEGKRIFHDWKELGGTIGVSCDMCHPDGSNTHPETYPKYQVQLQRVALLRDMIDWCIENPVKGKTLDPNDPKLRALEAYIYAQRKGVPLEYGKH
jgi:thiosulfate dehydrogenase